MKTKEEIIVLAGQSYWSNGLDKEGFYIVSYVKGYEAGYTEAQSQLQQEWIPVEEETAREPIQDALYATGRFTKDECDVLSDGILRYINDANLVITPQPYNPTKS